MNVEISGGVVHEIPGDLREVFLQDSKLTVAWESLTTIARNEWICWIDSAKQATTRARRLKRAQTELLEGIRRPCCWIGCVHRTDKDISPSVQHILNRNKKPPRKTV